jgi:hypothetical protein
MGTRNDIADSAIWESNFGHWKPTDREMINIFTIAGLKPPTAADLAKFKTASGNVPVNGYSISWCGIFAAYVLKRWGGLDVRWKYWVKGKPSGLIGPGVNYTAGSSGMRPGDVAVITGADKNGNRTDHHFIVTHVDYSKNVLHSVDGNSTNNEIVWHTDKKIKGNKKSTDNIYGHYKLAI